MRSFLLASLLSLLLVTGFFILGMNALIKKDVDPIIADHIRVETIMLTDYLADNEFLRQRKIFECLFHGRKTIGTDAGPELNQLLHWLPEQPHFKNSPLVPADIQDFILRLGRNWSLHTSPFKVFFDRKRVDLKIFQSLSKYSYWDVEKNSPVTRLISENTHVPTDSLPSIDSLDLIALAKLRYIQAIFTNDHLQALKDGRQLVDLLLTTENYHLELTAIAILEAEHSAYNLYVSNNWVQPEAWAPVDSNSTRRANRAFKATKELLRFWTPIPILKQVFLTSDFPIGFCAGIGDAFSRELAVRKDMTANFPMERDYRENYEVFDSIWAKAKTECHLDYLSAAQGSGKFQEINLPGGFLAYLPYSKKLFGLSQSANFFEGFKDYIEANPHATN